MPHISPWQVASVKYTIRMYQKALMKKFSFTSKKSSANSLLKYAGTWAEKDFEQCLKEASFTCSRWIGKSNGFDGVDLAIHTERERCQLKADILERFGPQEKALRRKITISKLGFSDNDLWIASVAKRYDVTIVSADNDFQRLKDVEELSLETWWSPDNDKQ